MRAVAGPSSPRAPGLLTAFGALSGVFLGLTIVKFGNPVILDRLIEPPSTLLEYLFQPWPVAWGYTLLAALAGLGVWAIRGRLTLPSRFALLPAVWLAWQFVAGLGTIDTRLTAVTLMHFTAGVAGFYLGLFALAKVQRMAACWAGLLVGFLVMLWTGFGQHYGGLEATREFVLGSPHFAPGHIRDSSGFAQRLVKHSDPVSVALWERLPEGTRQALATVGAGSALAGSTETNLVAALNQLIEGPSLYRADRFAGVTLSYESRGLVDQSARGDRLVRLNRLLLEDVYPAHVPSYHVISKPDWRPLAPEHLKRINSDRIFGTLLYPNTLAGALLLLGPVMGMVTWRLAGWLTPVTRSVLVGLVGYCSLACLFWSGSKAGWLIALGTLLAYGFHLPFQRSLKLALAGVVLVAGLAGFFWKFSHYFARGATSVGARFEYWSAAWKTALEHPGLGTGPGTFSVAYRKLKPPEAEMAMLTHNDYLEQASDSGWVGAVLYLGFVGGALVRLHPKCRGEPMRLAVWLGLLAWALQGLTEFGAYIPAIAWVAFWLLGWLWGQPTPQQPVLNPFDRAMPRR